MESWLRAQVAANGAQEGVFSGMSGNGVNLDGRSWRREPEMMEDLITNYHGAGITGPGESLKPGGLEQVVADHGMRWTYLDILGFNKDALSARMMTFGHLFIAYFSFHMYHAVVGYGFSDAGVLVMNPAGNGSLTELTYEFLRGNLRFQEKILVGWAEAGKPLAVDHAADKYLSGNWHVRIGDWAGYFSFSVTANNGNSGVVTWRTFDQSIKHPGKWKREGLLLTWQFSDDPSGWVRTFRIVMNGDGTLADRMQGDSRTPQGTTGIFTMSRADD